MKEIYIVVERNNSCEEDEDDVKCVHEWKKIDASFDHEFGTEVIIYYECQLCGCETKDEPASETEDFPERYYDDGSVY